MANEDKKQNRVAVKAANGMTVWLPEDQVEAFQQGQTRSEEGQKPAGAEQKASELLSLLRRKAGK